ncbi:hypothetical protein ACI3EW_15880 [Pilosibacter sp. HC1M1C21]
MARGVFSNEAGLGSLGS